MRRREEIKFEKETIVTYLWKKEGARKKGTIQIFHGMAEHILRYEPFIETLIEDGYVVIGHDHIAHGSSTTLDKIGVIEEGDYMTKTLECCKAVREHYRDYFSKGFNYLFGHSMGSMIALRYAEVYPNDFEKVILSGTDIGSLKYKFASIILKQIIKKQGPISYPELVHSLSFKPFNNKFKEEKNEFSWLSANKENVKNYENDKYCGKRFPTNYFYSLSLFLNLTKKELNEINSKTQFLLLSGKDDPVTNYGKSTEKLHKLLKKNNIDVKSEIYYSARHEILNEKN